MGKIVIGMLLVAMLVGPIADIPPLLREMVQEEIYETEEEAVAGYKLRRERMKK